MKSYYPINVDIRDRPCLVVGGGKVAERKVQALLECGGRVTVVALESTALLHDLADRQAIRLESRGVEDADLDPAFIIIAATDDASVNAAVSEGAERRGKLLNVVDQPELCNFIVPAVCDFGPVRISVSTSGASPALARWLREKLEADFGEWLGCFATMLAEVRDEVKARYDQEYERRKVWRAILDSDALELARQGREDAARERIRACISSPSG